MQSNSKMEGKITSGLFKFVCMACSLVLFTILPRSDAATSKNSTGSAPPAPAPISPPNGSEVIEPFSIVWSAVNDPSGITAYNWQISTSPTFVPVLRQDSADGQTTQGTISGLPFGIYYWRVQAVNGASQQGAWSQPISFDVTGSGPGAPGTPTLEPTQGYSTFHPYESIRFHWSDVPEAVTYRLEVSTDPSFPIANIP